jgi:hypothetical protein
VFNNPVGAFDKTGYVPQDCPPNCATGARGAYQSNSSKVINHFSEKAQSRSLDGPNESHKTGGEIVAGSIPGVGEAADAYEFATGKTITGRDGSRLLAALGLAIPFAGAAALRGGGEIFSRSLKKSDLGIEGNVRKLEGKFKLSDDRATVRVDMIDADIDNPFIIVKNVVNTAKSKGAKVVRLEGTIANPKLQKVLSNRYNLKSKRGNDYIEIKIDQ